MDAESRIGMDLANYAGTQVVATVFFRRDRFSWFNDPTGDPLRLLEVVKQEILYIVEKPTGLIELKRQSEF